MTRFRGLFYKREDGMEKKKKGLNIRTSTNTTANSLSGVFPLFWYNKEKGADTMMNPTMLVPIALDAWYSDENNDSLLQTELENYLQNYFPCFSLRPKRRLFQTFIQGLLSPSPFTFPVKSMSSCPGRLGQAAACCPWMTQAL